MKATDTLKAANSSIVEIDIFLHINILFRFESKGSF